jgi:hypothetical protein
MAGMLEALRQWAHRRADVWASHGIHVEITMGEGELKPGMRLDFDTHQVVGRITCWDSGECDLEVLAVETTRSLYSKQQTLATPANFDSTFQDFLRILGAPL